jgi:hypothetical protein
MVGGCWYVARRPCGIPPHRRSRRDIFAPSPNSLARPRSQPGGALSTWTARRRPRHDSRWRGPRDRLRPEASQRSCARAAPPRFRGVLPRNEHKAALLRPGLETTLRNPTNASFGDCDSSMKEQGKYDYSTFIPPTKEQRSYLKLWMIKWPSYFLSEGLCCNTRLGRA